MTFFTAEHFSDSAMRAWIDRPDGLLVSSLRHDLFVFHVVYAGACGTSMRIEVVLFSVSAR